MKLNSEQRPHALPAQVDYLVGGLRIGLGSDSTTPGPRSHIQHFVASLRWMDSDVKLIVASELPLMSRFARMPEGSVNASSRKIVFVGDIVRIGAAVWCGAWTFARGLRRRPGVIYERVAVMQSLTSFHPYKAHAVRVVESNGIMSLETAQDRGALVLQGFASRIERHVYRRADLIATVSEPLAAALVDFAGVERNKILVVPNAIPDETNRIPLSATEAPIIGFAGAVVPWQRIDLLLNALAACQELEWTVEVVGSGPELEPLRDLAKSLGLSARVLFLGRLTQQQTFERMATWSVGYSGHGESSGHAMYHSPLKLYEYAGFGLNAICSPSGDADLLAADGMHISEFKDPHDLLSAIRMSLETLPSLNERERLRKHLSQQHGWDSRVRAVFTAALTSN